MQKTLTIVPRFRFRITGGASGYITIAGGVAIDAEGNGSIEIGSTCFDLMDDNSDKSLPIVTISAASIENDNGKVTYSVAVGDNVGAAFFGIHKDDIVMNGFTADIDIIDVSDYIRTITFYNIKSIGDMADKYFILKHGVAKDDVGNGSYIKNLPPFSMES